MMPSLSECVQAGAIVAGLYVAGVAWIHAVAWFGCWLAPWSCS